MFLKTETDTKTLELWDGYESGISAFEKAEDKEGFKLSSKIYYDNIRAYLNIFELIACGIKHKIVDAKMCRNYFINVFL